MSRNPCGAGVRWHYIFAVDLGQGFFVNHGASLAPREKNFNTCAAKELISENARDGVPSGSAAAQAMAGQAGQRPALLIPGFAFVDHNLIAIRVDQDGKTANGGIHRLHGKLHTFDFETGNFGIQIVHLEGNAGSV